MLYISSSVATPFLHVSEHFNQQFCLISEQEMAGVRTSLGLWRREWHPGKWSRRLELASQGMNATENDNNLKVRTRGWSWDWLNWLQYVSSHVVTADTGLLKERCSFGCCRFCDGCCNTKEPTSMLQISYNLLLFSSLVWVFQLKYLQFVVNCIFLLLLWLHIV